MAKQGIGLYPVVRMLIYIQWSLAWRNVKNTVIVVPEDESNIKMIIRVMSCRGRWEQQEGRIIFLYLKLKSSIF